MGFSVKVFSGKRPEGRRDVHDIFAKYTGKKRNLSAKAEEGRFGHYCDMLGIVEEGGGGRSSGISGRNSTSWRRRGNSIVIFRKDGGDSVHVLFHLFIKINTCFTESQLGRYTCPRINWAKRPGSALTAEATQRREREREIESERGRRSLGERSTGHERRLTISKVPFGNPAFP